jgi:DNA-directed RNA polymerase beta subunit
MFPINEFTSPDVNLDIDSKRFLSLMSKFGHTNGVIDGFNNFIENVYIHLKERRFTYKGIDSLHNTPTYTTFYWDRPNIEEPKLTPMQVLERAGESYSLELFADLHIEVKDASGAIINKQVVRDVSHGRIPIPLKSKFDPLMKETDKSVEENMENAGEDISGPPYFIVDSKKYTFNLSDQLRVGIVLSYMKSINGNLDTLTTTITTESRLGKTAKVSIYLHTNKKFKYILFEDFIGFTEGRKKKSIDVLDVFSLLQFYDMNLGKLEDFILSFTDPKWRDKLLVLLSPSLGTHEWRRSLADSNPNSIYQYIKTFKGEVGNKPRSFYNDMIDNNLFTHMNDSTEPIASRRLKKMALLATMIVRLLETYLGLRLPDDRNSYAIKRFKNVGSAMHHTYVLFLEERMENLYASYQEKKAMTADAIHSSFAADNIYKHYVSSFTKSWGLVGKTSKRAKKPIYTETLKDDEYILQHTHANKSVRGRDVHSKNYLIRKVYGSQLHSVCPGETPESERVSLTNTKANIEYNSQHRDDRGIYQLLKSNALKSLWKEADFYRNSQYNAYLQMNGVLLGVCEGISLERELVKLRRAKAIYFDVCIAFYESYNTLFIFSDAGRPCAPFLVVDGEDLLIDKLGLQNEIDCMVLLERGAYDFTDTFEREYKNICFSTKEFYRLKDEKYDLRKSIEIMQDLLSELNDDNTEQMFVPSFNDPKDIVLVQERKKEFEEYLNEVIAKRNQHLQRYNYYLRELESLVKDNDTSSFEDRYNDLNALIQAEITNIDKLNINQIKDLETENAIAFSRESLIRTIEQSVERLKVLEYRSQFDYCDVDPVSALGITMSLLPFLNHNPGPRQTFGCKMIKQAQSIPSFSLHWNPRPTKMICYPSRAAVETSTWKFLNLHTHPVGFPVTIAITISQSTVEDMIQVSKGFIEAGGFRSMTFKVVSEEIKLVPQLERGGEIITTYITNKLPDDVIKGRKLGYENLGEDGYAVPGSVIKLGDVLIGRYKRITDSKGNVRYKDDSIYAKRSKVGVIRSILVKSKADKTIVQFDMVQVKTPEVGDKFSNAHAQKSTIGLIENDAEMPYSAETGITPDILTNSHGQPSRMTFGMLREILYGKANAFNGHRYDGTAYRDREATDMSVEAFLSNLGFQARGKEVYISKTGQMLNCEIYTGICYYYRLVHESGTKIQNRDIGPYKQITHQASTGMDNYGGQKKGEMEIETLQSHGAAYTVKSYTTTQSDYYIYFSCKKCNNEIFRYHTGLFHCKYCSRFLPEDDVKFCESAFVFQTLNNYEKGMAIALKPTLRITDKDDDLI